MWSPSKAFQLSLFVRVCGMWCWFCPLWSMYAHIRRDDGPDVWERQTVQALYGDGCHCHRMVVIQVGLIDDFFGTGIMLEVLRHVGTLADCSKWLRALVNTSACCPSTHLKDPACHSVWSCCFVWVVLIQDDSQLLLLLQDQREGRGGSPQQAVYGADQW